ncbi:MAG: recombinase family protein [Paludibacteraceae bacterium]|nr:recombinase family protein [Paludibacteraceae bacterium]
MNKTAIIYARVSSTTDRQNTDRQVMDLTKYAETHGYSVNNTFSEKISGAKKNSERIVLQDAIQYAISNQVEAILVSELSRLGRSVYEVQESIKIIAVR